MSSLRPWIMRVPSSQARRNTLKKRAVTSSQSRRRIGRRKTSSSRITSPRFLDTLVRIFCRKDSGFPAINRAISPSPYTLIHDDVMDRADIRRGKPTVCAKWGDTAAILSGDTMLVLAYEFIAHAPVEKLPAMLALFTETAKEVGDGQQYDLDFENRDDVVEEEYMV